MSETTPYSAFVDAPDSKPPRRVRGLELTAVMCLLLVSGSVNFVLLKVLFTAYGEANAFFVSQGINLLYVVYGGLVTYPRLLGGGVGSRISAWMGMEPITPAMRRSPQRRFIVMGLLDCFGTFFTAMGAVHTPGQLQPVLNQSLVPCTMVVSCVLLRSRYSWCHSLGAMLIVSGALVSLSPSLSHHSGSGAADSACVSTGDCVRIYSIAIYWLSNVPMALSVVYKESRFHNETMDVCWLTQWVSIYQFLFGFVLAPLQLLPGMSSARGVPARQMLDGMASGWACFIERDATGCAERHTMLLLFAYVGVNFVFNTTGLWLTKHGGAVLNSISYAMLVPLTTVFFSFPFLGPYREKLHAATFGGLAIVLIGFALWRYATLRDESAAAAAATAPTSSTSAATAAAATAAAATDADATSSQGDGGNRRSHSHVSSFQERVIIGMDSITMGAVTFAESIASRVSPRAAARGTEATESSYQAPSSRRLFK